MRHRRPRPLPLLFGAAVVAAMVHVGVVATTQPASTGVPSLERLYSLPRLIGTAPIAPAWSPDSAKIAFLWNDEGTNFYDVWLLDVANPEPRRLTRFPRPTVADTGDEVARRQAATRAERDPGVTSVAWHPDGARLLVSLAGDLYFVTPGAEPQRLTSTPAPESRAAFDRAGRNLAYLREGDLWIHDLASPGAAPRRLTTVAAPAVGIESYQWSPDGSQVAFVEVDRTRVTERGIPDYLTEETRLTPVRRAYPGEQSDSRRLGLVPAGGGDVQWPTLGPDRQDPIFGYDWSPDGRELVVDTSDLFVKHRRLLIVDAASARVEPWFEERDPNNVSAQWWARWAPDGRGIYFVSDRDEDYHVYYRARTGGDARRVTRGAWAVFDAMIAPGARALFVVGNQGRAEERQVYRVPLDGGEPVRVSHRAGTHDPTISPDGRWAAVQFSSDDTPPDLLLARVDVARAGADTERQVTHSPLPEFRQYTWLTPHYVTFPQHNDGATLHGRLLLPPALSLAPSAGTTSKYPAILGSVYSNTVRNQWGGRNAHPVWGLDQYLAHRGYVLLTVDVSGSAGHGKAFRQRIRVDYGRIDVEDLHSGVKYLLGRGDVDANRVGIWGSSYGGLMTTMSLFTKPGVYKAGVAGAPATNVWHALTGEMRVMTRPQDEAAAYAEASSFTQAAGLRDHLMIIHGMRDRTVLFKDSVALTQRLIQLDKDVDLVALPDADHGWDLEGLAQTRFAFRKLAGHFDRYLGAGPK